MTNSRIRNNELGATIERIATETHIFYDPKAVNADIIFQGEEYLTSPDGQLVGDKLDGRQSLTVTLAQIMARTFDAGVDPVTGADLSAVSAAGVTSIMKAVYDALHNERFAPAPVEDGAE
jgi:hypothetical protein